MLFPTGPGKRIDRISGLGGDAAFSWSMQAHGFALCHSDGSTTRPARGKAGARAPRHGEITRSLMIMVHKKAALAQTVQQYDFPDKNFINKVYTHRLNELFAESAPQLTVILGLVMPFAE